MDTIKTLEEGRGQELTVSKGSRYRGLNWDGLRAKVERGMRNATLMAVAPNANIGLVAGTTPGIDPRFAQVFSRNKISGKYLDLNHNLVNDLKNMGLWESVRDVIIQEQGDLTNIPSIPQHIKDIYKTSFSTSPYAFIEVAARAQKWIDQALSRNMYLETRDIEETADIYSTAWRKGVKTTYYLHMKPRHTAEQSTTKVNKAEKMGKRGFADVMGSSAVAAQSTVDEVIANSMTVSEPIAEPAVALKREMKIEEPVRAMAMEVETIAPRTASAPKIETAVAKTGPFANVTAQVVSTQKTEFSSPQPASSLQPPASKIMPPSDPQADLVCDSCQ